VNVRLLVLCAACCNFFLFSKQQQASGNNHTQNVTISSCDLFLMIKQLKKSVVESVPSGTNKNTFALFDVLVSSKPASTTLIHQQRGNEIHANAARFLEVLTPKKFVHKNKKKKKLSILKKRILLVFIHLND
jgi:hypothetical protein